jgi:hypothetical protein
VLKDGSEQGVDGPSLPRNNGAHLVVCSVISHLGTLLLVFRVVVDFLMKNLECCFKKPFHGGWVYRLLKIILGF